MTLRSTLLGGSSRTTLSAFAAQAGSGSVMNDGHSASASTWALASVSTWLKLP
ncbi:hypothetical protein D3C85_1837010 [compost metagenome]